MSPGLRRPGRSRPPPTGPWPASALPMRARRHCSCDAPAAPARAISTRYTRPSTCTAHPSVVPRNVHDCRPARRRDAPFVGPDRIELVRLACDQDAAIVCNGQLTLDAAGADAQACDRHDAPIQGPGTSHGSAGRRASPADAAAGVGHTGAVDRIPAWHRGCSGRPPRRRRTRPRESERPRWLRRSRGVSRSRNRVSTSPRANAGWASTASRYAHVGADAQDGEVTERRDRAARSPPSASRHGR